MINSFRVYQNCHQPLRLRILWQLWSKLKDLLHAHVCRVLIFNHNSSKY